MVEVAPLPRKILKPLRVVQRPKGYELQRPDQQPAAVTLLLEFIALAGPASGWDPYVKEAASRADISTCLVVYATWHLHLGAF